MTEMTRPTAVHLVGSIGLDTVEDVFRTVGSRQGFRQNGRPPSLPTLMLVAV